MKTTSRRSGFTLIEVLIVVVIMAILAATIIPQFTDSTQDAQQSTVDFNAHTMRSQIELYRVQHGSKYPTISGEGTLPQLTERTKADGTEDSAGEFGPYMSEIPPNLFITNSTAPLVKATAAVTPAAGDGSSHWQYNATTGGIWPNHTGFTP